MPVSREQREQLGTGATTLDWWRARLQHLANTTKEPWLLLSGFKGATGQGDVSSVTLLHGVPWAGASPKELSQVVEEFHPE